VVFFGLKVRGNRVGIPPIGRLAYLLAKAGMSLSIVLLFAKAAFDSPRLSAISSVVVLCLLLGGGTLFTLSLWQLGSNLRMGLPEEETALVTSGVYRISRNPIYVGIFLILCASLVYAFSWLNAAAVSVGVALHHCIVLAEERFLSKRFSDYDSYRRRVRRYL